MKPTLKIVKYGKRVSRKQNEEAHCRQLVITSCAVSSVVGFLSSLSSLPPKNPLIVSPSSKKNIKISMHIIFIIALLFYNIVLFLPQFNETKMNPMHLHLNNVLLHIKTKIIAVAILTCTQCLVTRFAFCYNLIWIIAMFGIIF